ncbi:MAG: sigma-70 family RNA polymerase sigma factor [Planctomycetia bacterium]|nr:sigma-70 family RNA polymerase sigma factor [Planctomycetia bacterium]
MMTSTTGSHKNAPHGAENRGDLASASDEQLMLRYRDDHDSRAYETLVHRYEREIYSYLRRYLGDAELAEDAFQGTFLQVHLKCGQFDADRRFRPWLYTVATNQAIDLQRRNKRHKMVSLDGPSRSSDDHELAALIELVRGAEAAPSAQMETEERRTWVRDAVSSLPEMLKAAVTLVYYQGLKYREAAEVLDIPVGTVKSRLHAALLKLNESWLASHPHPEAER